MSKEGTSNLTERRYFQTLEAAVDYISGTLDSGNYEALLNQIEQSERHIARDPSYPDYFQKFVFSQLQDRHRKLDLRRLYSEQSFPKEQQTYKLGGHMQELGCIHIDFLKVEQGWIISDIWICR
jgi:hypothetical protein